MQGFVSSVRIALSFGSKFPNRVENSVHGSKFFLFSRVVCVFGLYFSSLPAFPNVDVFIPPRETSSHGAEVGIYLPPVPLPPPPPVFLPLFLSPLCCSASCSFVSHFCNSPFGRTRPAPAYRKSISINSSEIPSLSSSRQSLGSISTLGERRC